MREGAVSKVLLLPERQAVPLPDRGYREETHAVSDSAPSIAGLKPENLASFFLPLFFAMCSGKVRASWKTVHKIRMNENRLCSPDRSEPGGAGRHCLNLSPSRQRL